LSRNCLQKHVTDEKKEGKTEEKIEEGVRGGRRRKQLLNDIKGEILETEREVLYRSARDTLWKRLWTCGKAEQNMAMWPVTISRALRLLASQKEISSRNCLLD